MRAPQISCSFSGHRPEKLPWGDNERDERCLALKDAIRQMVEKAYADGYRHFICGMARGCDTYFCEEVLQLRRRVQDITLEAAIPCLSPERRLDGGTAGAVSGSAGAVQLSHGGAGEVRPRLHAPAQPLHGGSQQSAAGRP